MALESWLIKVKTTISNSLPTSNIKKRPKIVVLAFEISGLMSKLLHLWQSLSHNQITDLHKQAIALDGVKKLVSDDESFLLTLACAEMVETLRLIARSISRLCKRCNDVGLQHFDRFFDEFADSGLDTHSWVMTRKEMEKMAKKMTRYVARTSELHKQMEELPDMERALKRLLESCRKDSRDSPPPAIKMKKVAELQQKLLLQRNEVKHLKESSLWCLTFETVASMLARSSFTVLARIKQVFAIGHEKAPSSLPRTFSTSSAAVHPSDNSTPCKFISKPLTSKPQLQDSGESKQLSHGCFFFSNMDVLKPPPSTLGAVALALHYANLIIIIEKMVRSPHLIGVDTRDDLYSMLPTTMRVLLRKRLRGVGYSASDPALAGEWREALRRILEWLSPLAHNMIRWQSERSLEQQKTVARQSTTGVLLLQTLYFADQVKTEAAIAELLVGLNYVWRFEREMNAKVLSECSNALSELQGNG
ncbi:hypothetical protein AAC387_Pa01g3268 [Persea americana]